MKNKRGSFLKNVAMLGGARGISQGLTLAASPVLTRIFSPEDFGVFALFAVLIGLLGGLSCMRYEHALPLARDEVEAANIFALCGAILCVFLFVFCVVLLAVHDDLDGQLTSRRHPADLLLLFLTYHYRRASPLEDSSFYCQLDGLQRAKALGSAEGPCPWIAEIHHMRDPPHPGDQGA